MSTATKSKWVNVFTIFVLILTAFQGLIPTMPITNASTIAIVSAVTMFAVSALTTWKQYLSVEIDNKSLTPTIIVAIVATVGALNELFDVVHFSSLTSQWIRFGITAITMMLNLVSKIMWPTEQTKSTL